MGRGVLQPRFSMLSDVKAMNIHTVSSHQLPVFILLMNNIIPGTWYPGCTGMHLGNNHAYLYSRTPGTKYQIPPGGAGTRSPTELTTGGTGIK